MPQWDRANSITVVRRRLWQYLSAKAVAEEIPSVAEGLFQLPRGDLRRLAAVHVALDPNTRAALDACARILRELPSSVVRSEVELVGAVRGPVSWDRTLYRQLVTADASRYVCRPPERRYDTPLARLVHLVLRRARGLSTLAGFRSSGRIAERIASVALEADHLLMHAKLSEVTQVESLPERTLVGLRRYRQTGPLIEFVRTAREAIDLLDPRRVEEVISSQVLAPLSDDALFELQAGFAIADALVASGYKEDRRLIDAEAVPFGTFHGAYNLTLWWQRSPWTAVFTGLGGRYKDTLDANGMSSASLRPDFLLSCASPPRLLMIEVKQTAVENAGPERRGVLEAMAYLHDLGAQLDGYPVPRALVIGWDASASPGISPIIVANQDRIAAAIDLVLTSWQEGA